MIFETRHLNLYKWISQLNIDSTSKLVLHAMAVHCDKNYECYPGIARISKNASLHRSSVILKLKELEKLKLITKKTKAKGGLMTIYRLNIELNIVIKDGELQVGLNDLSGLGERPVRSGTTTSEVGENDTKITIEENHEDNHIRLNMSNCKQLLVISDKKQSLSDDSNAQNIQPKKPEGIPCPHNEIVDLYHETLPMCPRVKNWTVERQKLLRARWREKSTRQNLDWWKGYFEYVGKSRFLTGLVEAAPGRQSFLATLEWLIRPSNFAKVVEGIYHKGSQ
jgi:hypothetical protein